MNNVSRRLHVAVLRTSSLAFAALTSLSCATRPMLDAYVNPNMSQGFSFDYAEVISKDQFSGSVFSDRGLYAWPIGITYDRVSYERLQWGVGLLGAYQKLAIKPPDEYDRFCADNIALTQFVAGGLSTWSGHSGEDAISGGFLLGVPLTKHFSLTTGIGGTLSHMSNESDSVRHHVYRRSLFLPLNGIIRSVHHKISVGIEFPLASHERYSMAVDRGDSMNTVGASPSANRINPLLRISYSFQK